MSNPKPIGKFKFKYFYRNNRYGYTYAIFNDADRFVAFPAEYFNEDGTAKDVHYMSKIMYNERDILNMCDILAEDAYEHRPFKDKAFGVGE